MLSLIITMGFIHQDNTGNPRLGDEFDHLERLNDTKAPVELIVVDRAWPRRWNRLIKVLGTSSIVLKYIRPKPSPFFDYGYRAVNAMRNSGAIVSVGDVVIFVDDYLFIDGPSLDEIHREWTINQEILCPVHREEYFPIAHNPKYQEFSGHNPGIYMCSREQFLKLGGFNENFDGAYGQEDTEFQERLDRLLDKTPEYKLRKRRHGLLWQMTEHTNGIFPQPFVYPWAESFPDLITTPDTLRCNHALYHLVIKQRMGAGVLDTTEPLTNEEIEVLRDNKCNDGCTICGREDKEQQAQSYQTMSGDHRIAYRMERWKDKSSDKEGKFDPWARQRNFAGSRFGLWNVEYAGYTGPRKLYGKDSTTAKMAATFLNVPEVQVIEDWGCGYGGFKEFIGEDQKYVGVDGSITPFADVTADLTKYRSEPDGLLLRHVLEHNPNWEAILENALASYQKRMVIVIFTPFVSETKIINRYPNWRGDERGIDMVDVGFNREEFFSWLEGESFCWERVETETQYQEEHLFYFIRNETSFASGIDE